MAAITIDENSTAESVAADLAGLDIELVKKSMILQSRCLEKLYYSSKAVFELYKFMVDRFGHEHDVIIDRMNASRFRTLRCNMFIIANAYCPDIDLAIHTFSSAKHIAAAVKNVSPTFIKRVIGGAAKMCTLTGVSLPQEVRHSRKKALQFIDKYATNVEEVLLLCAETFALPDLLVQAYYPEHELIGNIVLDWQLALVDFMNSKVAAPNGIKFVDIHLETV